MLRRPEKTAECRAVSEQAAGDAARRSRPGLLALVALATCGAAFGETAPGPPLKGLNDFSLTVSLDEDAAVCGVERERIANAVRAVLEGTRLRLESDAERQLIARATTSPVSEGVCAFGFALEVVTRVTIAETGSGAFAPVWSRQAITCGPAGSATRLVDDVFRFASRALVADWIEANE